MDTYADIVTWNKNMFEPPKGKAGKDFVIEITRLMQLFNNRTKWESLALQLLNIFIPLMLQKPSAKSKAKDHTRYLNKRIELWKSGKVSEIMSECKEIQKRLVKSKRRQQQSILKGFTNLMLLGKVKQAIKLIDSDSEITGVHEITERIKDVLKKKHPDGGEIDESAVLKDNHPVVESVIFENINQDLVKKAAKTTFGSGGPTQVTADLWKFIICSKSFGNCSDFLAEEIAILARRMCTEKIPYKSIQTFLACRLVPLMKDIDGVRPIGIGETLRRIVGKCVNYTLQKDIQIASGTLQTCAGIESGIEAYML